MFDLMGYKAEHLLGKSLYEFHHGSDSEGLMASFKCCKCCIYSKINHYYPPSLVDDDPSFHVNGSSRSTLNIACVCQLIENCEQLSESCRRLRISHFSF